MISGFFFSDNIKKINVLGWHKIRICSECDCRLSENTFYYGDGICNHCGHDSGSTICNSTNIIVRHIETIYKGILVPRTIVYEGKTDKDKVWIRDYINDMYDGDKS